MGRITLRKGYPFTLTIEQIVGDERQASVSCAQLTGDLREGAALLINDGLMGLRVNLLADTRIGRMALNDSERYDLPVIIDAKNSPHSQERRCRYPRRGASCNA